MDTYTSYRLAQLICCALPRRFAYWIGLRLADRFFSADSAGRRAVMSNYRQILSARGVSASEETLARMARRNFQYFGKYLVDFFKFVRFTPEKIKRLVSFERRGCLDQAQALNRGVILITAHLGNWELGGAVLAAMGVRVNAVFLPQRLSKVNALFQRQRSHRGITCIPIGQAARCVIGALRRHEAVAMLADRDFTAHAVETPFFGRPAHLSSGPVRMALKTQAPLLPCFLLRQPDDTFLMRFHPPIVPAPDSTPESLQLALRDVLEREIGEHPLQWFMFDDFWDPRRNHDDAIAR